MFCFYVQINEVSQVSQESHFQRIFYVAFCKFLCVSHVSAVLCVKHVFTNFAKFTETIKRHDFFLTKLQRFSLETLLKKGLRYRCFPVNLTKFLRTSNLQNTSRRLLLCLVSFSEILVKKLSE